MVSRKRRVSNPVSDASVSPGRPMKRPRHSQDDENDDLAAILAQIKQQEDSEALARQLQEEWNNEAAEDRVEGSSDIHLDVGPFASSSGRQLRSSGGSIPQNVAAGTSHNASSSNLNEDETPDIPLAQARHLFTGDRQCPGCKGKLKSPRGYPTFSVHTPAPSVVSLLHLPCKKCKKNHCRSCLAVLTCDLTCKGTFKNSKCVVERCCTNVRAIALFEVLGAFDRLSIGEKETSAARAAAHRPSKVAHTVGPGGTGYGTGGVEYNPPKNTRRGAAAVSVDTRSKQAQNSAEHWDELVVRAFTNITTFLPDPDSENAQAFDLIPHESLRHLLSLSLLPELLGSLLRNDSVNDWVARSEIYYATLQLLRRLADCELTVGVLIDPQWEKNKTCGIEGWMWEEGEIVWDKTKDKRVSRTVPLYSHFKKVVKQSEAFLLGASQLLDGGDADVESMAIKATSLCGDMIAARDDIVRAMNVLGKSDLPLSDGPSQAYSLYSSAGKAKGKGKGRDSAEELERSYLRECEQLAFKHATLSVALSNGGLSYPTFHYAADVLQTAAATRTPKDRFHLVKELATMATSLPPGVWVRVDEVRNDVIKIMIAGPVGTPYEGGLFEFDCFMPMTYPHSPPLMHLRTTGGGRVRFNPNLYNEGKVCLSLLGTWPGRPEEQWSSTSTLLQVLVSIQSMILIDLPYFNEPGYGTANKSNMSSIAYNKNICLQTLKWAMVEWMQDTHKDGLWADVITSHFTIRGAAIRRTIQTWAKTQPRIQKYSDVKSGHDYGGLNDNATNAPSTATTDLISEYDLGIERVKAWPAG
ncbi:hypothetical protein FA95DRAFT_1555521 [Auriscalpium vulgare]|uniref:Uncharacterized protein n=1 Tax=Auriscalpium vulgare TaxID=40419 RepID=A0ACB8S3D9_9AGAM|nr:hypothetical protein FA95DRAFT_1555521 [Auriscalpium vulgare]